MPTEQLRWTVKTATRERFEKVIEKSRRSEALDNAITLYLDIVEGRRNLPELNVTDGNKT